METGINRSAHLNDGGFKLIVAGFSLFYAVCVSFFYSTWLAGGDLFRIQAFDNVLNPSMFLVAVIFALIARRHAPSSLVPSVGYVALAVATALLFLAKTTGLASFSLAAAAAAGAGMSLTAPFFFSALAPFSPRRIAAACGSMALAGMAVDMAWSYLPATALLGVQETVIVLSAICLFRANGSELPAAQASASLATRPTGRDLLGTFLVPGLGTFALSIVYGIIDAAATGAGSSPETVTSISKTGGLIAAIVFSLYFAVARRSSATLLFNVVFGILATGILFLPFLPGNYAVALNIFAAAGWKLVMLSLFYLVVVVYARHRDLLLGAIALAYALPRFGLFLGLNVALVFDIRGTEDFVRTTAVAFLLLYLVLMVAWFVNAQERRRAMSAAQTARERLDRYALDQENLRATRCSELAQEHGLTKRESDILELLSQGRDAVFISETLFLSRNTVKSYQKSIYAKLGIHSKQEVINLVSSLNASPQQQNGID